MQDQGDDLLIKRIEELMFLDQQRMEMLKVVAGLALPDCCIAAGFVRNLVWDHLHGNPPKQIK